MKHGLKPKLGVAPVPLIAVTWQPVLDTVKSRYNESLYNENRAITNGGEQPHFFV